MGDTNFLNVLTDAGKSLASSVLTGATSIVNTKINAAVAGAGANVATGGVTTQPPAGAFSNQPTPGTTAADAGLGVGALALIVGLFFLLRR